MSPAFVRASYAIIPIGLAAVPVGLYDAASGSPILGVVVAVLGLAAAGLSVSKLRSGHHWPFA